MKQLRYLKKVDYATITATALLVPVVASALLSIALTTILILVKG